MAPPPLDARYRGSGLGLALVLNLRPSAPPLHACQPARVVRLSRHTARLQRGPSGTPQPQRASRCATRSLSKSSPASVQARPPRRCRSIDQAPPNEGQVAHMSLWFEQTTVHRGNADLRNSWACACSALTGLPGAAEGLRRRWASRTSLRAQGRRDQGDAPQRRAYRDRSERLGEEPAGDRAACGAWCDGSGLAFWTAKRWPPRQSAAGGGLLQSRGTGLEEHRAR